MVGGEVLSWAARVKVFSCILVMALELSAVERTSLTTVKRKKMPRKRIILVKGLAS